ncbi:MAG: protein kinase [Acidobacteriota bacterium]
MATPDDAPADRRERAIRIAREAQRLDDGELGGFLERSCGSDSLLREMVVCFLDDDDDEATRVGGEGRLLSGDPTFGGAPLSTGSTPDHIAGYRIIRRLAAGGMGVVYEAEQDDPRRRVALKVLLPGLATPELLRRFRAEAQVLGQLQHEGIAQVHASGTEHGVAGEQPWFAMELVDGLPLDEHARVHDLSVADRIELLAKTCDAVQHAHQRGVVHRDLKPANVLVTRAGQPKILDFGVARVTGDEVGIVTLRTTPGEIVGTVAYMSPQQLRGEAHLVDARADVYSLGVIAYLLLTGELPHDVQGLPLHQAVAMICEGKPVRPGTLHGALRGDLETIIARALEQDPAQRYQSAAQLADDLRRYLRHEPILARPLSLGYQLRLFARRNRLLVGASAAVALARVVGIVASVNFAQREAEERRRADAQLEQAEQLLGVAERQRDEAQRRSYAAALGAASAAIESSDLIRARRSLGEAPPELRGWEWRHLSSRIDRSLRSSRIDPPGRINALDWRGEGFQLTVIRPGGPHGYRRWPRLDGLSEPEIESVGSGFFVSDDLLVSGHGDDCRLAFFDGEREARIIRFATPSDGAILASDPRGELLGVRQQAFVELVGRRGEEIFRLASWDTVPDLMDIVVDRSRGLIAWGGRNGRVEVRELDGIERALARGNADSVSVAADWRVDLRGGSVRRLALSPDGRTLYTVGADASLYRIDLDRREPFALAHGRGNQMQALVVRPDGQQLAVGGGDGTVRLHDAVSGRLEKELSGHSSRVHSLAYSDDGHRLLSGDENGEWRLFNVGEDALQTLLSGHQSFVYGVAVDAEGRLAMTGAWDAAVIFWDLVDQRALARFVVPDRHRVTNIALEPDRLRAAAVASGGGYGGIWIADLVDGTAIVHEIDRPQQVAFTPDGQLWVVSQDSIQKIDPETGACHQQRRFFEEVRPRDLVFSPDGDFAVLTTYHDELLVLDPETGETWMRFEAGVGTVSDPAVSPDGRFVAVGSNDGRVLLFELGHPEPLVTMPGHAGTVHVVTFSPDGTRLFSGDHGGTIRVHDLAGEELLVLSGHGDYVYDLALAADGLVLSASGDGSVGAWSIQTEAEREAERRRARRRRQTLAEVSAHRPLSWDNLDQVHADLRADARLLLIERGLEKAGGQPLN